MIMAGVIPTAPKKYFDERTDKNLITRIHTYFFKHLSLTLSIFLKYLIIASKSKNLSCAN